MILIMLGGGIASGQDHFNPVEKTGVYSPIVITEATINGSVLEIGDEIGVFDGSLCVAAEVYEGEFPLSCSASMQYVSPNNDTLPGAVSGNPMYFRAWDKSYSQEVEAVATILQGGNFGDVLTVVEPLVAYTEISEVNENEKNIPFNYHLFQNYPNPFNPQTAISYQLSEASMVQISIYDVRGKKIRTLVNSYKPAGKYSITWDGCDNRKVRLSTGVYLIRMKANEFSTSRKVLLVQ
jgi:hypothetical protein